MSKSPAMRLTVILYRRPQECIHMAHNLLSFTGEMLNEFHIFFLFRLNHVGNGSI